MNRPSNTASPSFLPSPVVAPAVVTRPFYWSVRRELWENRYVVIAPLVIAAVLFFAFVVAAILTLDIMHPDSGTILIHGDDDLMKPYTFAAGTLILTMFLVGVVYCLGALQGERRDRSILFWKSLPVSDLTTVLAKASIPLVVLPLLCFAIIVGLQLLTLLLCSAGSLLNGPGAGTLWTRVPAFWIVVLPRGLIVLTMLHAPVYSWLLLVSGWARRATLLWAVLPPIAIGLVEKSAFNTSTFFSALNIYLQQSVTESFAYDAPRSHAIEHVFQLDKLEVLSGPYPWIGLAVAGAFLAAAVWLRRTREPF